MINFLSFTYRVVKSVELFYGHCPHPKDPNPRSIIQTNKKAIILIFFSYCLEFYSLGVLNAVELFYDHHSPPRDPNPRSIKQTNKRIIFLIFLMYLLKVLQLRVVKCS